MLKSYNQNSKPNISLLRNKETEKMKRKKWKDVHFVLRQIKEREVNLRDEKVFKPLKS